MNDKKTERLYREKMGEEALQRQLDLGRRFYPCCAADRTIGHLPVCENHPLRRKRA